MKARSKVALGAGLVLLVTLAVTSGLWIERVRLFAQCVDYYDGVRGCLAWGEGWMAPAGDGPPPELRDDPRFHFPDTT
jgi:hypothetical protein